MVEPTVPFSEPEALTMPTHVLDDPFHFMHRLLKLLPKSHSAFDAFSHDFSEAIFIRDKDDEAWVHAVLDAKAISWEYAKRAKASALNRRIWRYIPPWEILAERLQLLFNGYKGIMCSTRQGHKQRFFSKEAEAMSE